MIRLPRLTLDLDHDLAWLAGGILMVLLVSTLLSLARTRRIRSEARIGSEAYETARRVNAQIRAWWVMCAVFFGAVLAGPVGSVALFGLISFLALREFMTMTPTTASDHAALAWAFWVITPLQYAMVALGWYGLFSIFIPVYAFLFIPIRNVLAGDPSRFLERTATVQWGLMVSVYCVSHVPALLGLEIPGYAGQNAKLLVYFVLLVQVGDVLMYVVWRRVGGPRLAPLVSRTATLPGLLVSAAGVAALGVLLSDFTPFLHWQAALVSVLVTVMGSAGKLAIAAIRRDRGHKDPGLLLEGSGGIFERIDSLCFAAPVFFHVTRYMAS